MRKETIIEIILSTMEEMRKLTVTFTDKEKIPQPFIDLLMNKYTTLGEEIQLLDFWKVASEAEESVAEPVKEEPKSAPAPAPVVEVKIEAPKVEVAPQPAVVEPEPKVAPATEVAVEPVAIVHEPKEPVVAPVQEVQPKEEPKVDIKPTIQPVRQASVSKSASSADTINYGTPVSDIRKAVGINDRFLYQRELFGGDAQRLNQALDAINACSTYEEAHATLKAFGWDETDATVEAFLKAVHRRFL